MARDCSRYDTEQILGAGNGLTPINDLGPQFYQTSYRGGLYPEGYNDRPPGHTLFGIRIAEEIRDTPLDVSGEVDINNGVILFVGIGMSNIWREWGEFEHEAGLLWPNLNPKVRFFNAGHAGATIETMDEATDDYWTTELPAALEEDGYSMEQIRVVLFENDYGVMPTPQTFPEYPLQMQTDLQNCIKSMYSSCANVKMCYCHPRIYGGYSNDPDRTEPMCYWGGWAYKWMIETQLTYGQTMLFDYGLGGIAVAPWLSFATYDWADGINPRYDGLNWLCSDFEVDDGVHPSSSGRYKVGQNLFHFFERDVTVRPWLFKEKGR